MNKLSVPVFEPGNDKEYEVKAYQDNAIYAMEADGYLPRLYYLVAWKSYPKEKNTWEFSLTVMHLRKIVSTFYRDYPKKPRVTSVLLDSALPMARPIVKPTDLLKQKQERPTGRAKKCTKMR